MEDKSKTTRPQVSPDKELKGLREKEEQNRLLFNTEALLPQTPKSRDLEIHKLQDNREFTLQQVKNLVSGIAREYEPMFPNNKPFFKLMYKLLKWDHLNPNDFIKPPVVAVYIKKYIYARFDREVLPTLLAKYNPLISGYIKKYKLFQFLNDEGLLLLEGYIQDAINVMEESQDWYDFELKYTQLYKLSVQLKLIN